MIKRVVFILLALTCLSAPLLAQLNLSPAEDELISRDDLSITGEVTAAPALALYRPDLFADGGGNLLLHGLPVLTLLDGRRFPIAGNSAGWGMTPLDTLPLAFIQAVRVRPASTAPLYGTDAPGGVVDFRLNRITTGGEAGVFYGGSGGKFGRQDFDSYIVGGVGTDNFQISAGASYQNSRGRGVSLQR